MSLRLHAEHLNILCYLVPLTSFLSSICQLTVFALHLGGFPLSSCVSEVKEWDFTQPQLTVRHHLYTPDTSSPNGPAEKTSVHSCISTFKRQKLQLCYHLTPDCLSILIKLFKFDCITNKI